MFAGSEPIDKLKAYTVLFETFVWLQVANMILSRKEDAPNPFEGIAARKHVIIFAIVFIFVLQVLLLLFGGKAMRLMPLSDYDDELWGWIGMSIAVAIISFATVMLLRLIPARWFGRTATASPATAEEDYRHVE